MKDMSYNILWMDDDFGIKKSMDDLYNNAKKDKRYQIFKITKCRNYAELEVHLSGKQKYQAVILDVLGYLSDDSQNLDQQAFFKAFELLSSKHIITKIFTGDPDTTKGGTLSFFKAKGLKEGKDYFYKANDYMPLFKVLKEELDAKMHLYKNFEFVLDMIEKNYIDDTNFERITHLLKDYNKNDLSIDDKLYLRLLLQDILENLVYKDPSSRTKYQFIKEEDLYKNKNFKPSSEEGRFGCLCNWFCSKLDNYSDDSKYKIIRDEGIKLEVYYIRPFIQFLWNTCNDMVHNKGEATQKIKYLLGNYMKTVYIAFFVITEWYYRHREHYNSITSCQQN